MALEVEGSGELGVRATGGQVDEMVMALIDSAYDKDGEVRTVIVSSLKELGRHQPVLVLSSCHAYLGKHLKLPQGHRVVILDSMQAIIRETVGEIDQGLARSIIKQASADLTQVKDVIPEWQTSASGVLVALGEKFCNEVMEELQVKFQPGVLPHFFVVQTMANLASTNVYGMVPFLKVVLGTMLPMLGLAKQDNMRWVFSSALCKFCEAILDYVANIEKAPDTSVKKEFFSAEIDSAYDVIISSWLNTKETKLRVMIVEALGQMSHVLTDEKLEQELPRLLQVLLNLYRRHGSDQYHITQGLGLVLGAASTSCVATLEAHLEQLLLALFPQMCQPVDYGNPTTVKNHNELLRCYTILASVFSDRLIPHLVQKLDGGNERTRIATVAILRHLINSVGTQLEDKRPLILAGMRQLLNDPSNKVKKELAQTVMAMSHHGYLELEGGQLMVEFIIRQCCQSSDHLAKRPADPDYVSNEALRSMCENVLQLMSSTVDNMDKVLWPYLLEFLTPIQYLEASGVICRCVANVTQHKEQEEDPTRLIIDFDAQANVPRPQELLARLIVLSGCPLRTRSRSTHVLQALQGLATNLGDGLNKVWGDLIPPLIKHIEDSDDDDDEQWDQKKWEGRVLNLLEETLTHMNSEDWTEAVGAAVGAQLPLYAASPDDKNFALKTLGFIMNKSSKKEFINRHLDVIFTSIKHSCEQEREGCAAAMGYVAVNHLDPVLVKLEHLAKNDGGKRSSGLFSFIKDSVSRSDVDEKVKATLILCYGQVTWYAQPSLITSRLETTILKAISNYFPNVKDVDIKHGLIMTTEMIASSVHPEHLMMNHVLKERNELLVYMENYLKLESTAALTTTTRTRALNACAHLVRLEPQLADEALNQLLTAALDSFVPLPPGGNTQPKAKEESYQEVIYKENLMSDVLNALHLLLAELLQKNPTPDGLETIYKHLHRWTLSLLVHERERALQLALKVFRLYLDKLETTGGISHHFGNLGSLLGRLAPRCTDPDVTVRQMAIDCVGTLLKIALRYQGFGEQYKDDAVESLGEIRERVKKHDANTMFTASKDIGQGVGKLLPADQLMPLLQELYVALSDPLPQSSTGACVILNSIIKARGGTVPNQVEQVLSALYGRLAHITCPQTYKGTLRAIRTLASHHLIATMTALLHYPLPYDEHTSACWRVIAEERMLVASMVTHLMDVLSKSLPYEERLGPRDKDPVERTATPLPVAITCALTEVFRVEDTAERLTDHYASLLGALMVRISSTIGVQPPRHQKDKTSDKSKDKDKKSKQSTALCKSINVDPCGLAVDGLRGLLNSAGAQEVINGLDEDDTWTKFTHPETAPEAFTLLMRLIIVFQPQHVCKLITVLNPTLPSVYEPQRIMVAAVFAECINQKCAGDLALVEMLVNALLGRLVDSSHSVRRLCIRGLGNVASVGREQVQRHSTTVLSAMMAGMDDKDDFDDLITLEAMSGLSRILAQIDEADIRAILINIALRIRPCFEKEQGTVRAAAFTLFGDLCRFADGPSKAPFLEQIHTNFVTLLLHLHDPNPAVRKSCKYALRLLGPLLGSESINTMFQRHLPEAAALHYGEFMNHLSKAIIQDFPDKLNFYIMGNVTFFRSSWSEIKSNAAMFVGFLLGNVPEEHYADISKEHVCAALVMLLKDTSPEVRVKAAEAMSRLHNF